MNIAFKLRRVGAFHEPQFAAVDHLPMDLERKEREIEIKNEPKGR